MKLHRTVPLDTRMLKESIQLLFPGFLTVTTGAFWTPLNSRPFSQRTQ